MSTRIGAAIDVGTNSVLLTVAAVDLEGGNGEGQRQTLRPLAERAEITRLGRGVDKTGRLSDIGMTKTLEILGAYAEEALELGVADPSAIACVATSAARDAANGPEFLRRVREETGLTLEIIAGEREAELMFLAARRDFGGSGGETGSLAVIDLGGGSTEFAIDVDRANRFAASYPIGSVRLHERWGEARGAAETEIEAAFSRVPKVGPAARAVGIAGTWTTLSTLALELAQYDAEKVHGSRLSVAAVEALADRLWGLTLSERLLLPGLQPGRADVIAMGASIASHALRALGASEVTVSDRGVRWGLLYERFLA